MKINPVQEKDLSEATSAATIMTFGCFNKDEG